MSTLIVEVCAVDAIEPHPNADRLEIAKVKNWRCVVQKDVYKQGDKVVYVPPESVLPRELAERWGIAKYCAELPKNSDGSRREHLRVRATRLRNQASQGTIQTPDDPSWEVGRDVKEHYGIKKYDPPTKVQDGDADTEISVFHKYTGIENLGNYPGVLVNGEEVVITEKLHGTNSRVGMVLHPHPETGEAVGTLVAGSHDIRRKEFDVKGRMSRYWLPFHIATGVEELVKTLFAENDQMPVVLFGELFGPGVQDMHYGQTGISFRAFDISLNGRYLDFEDMERTLNRFGVPMVPLLYRGPFSMEKVDALVDGPTTLAQASEIKEKFKGREGIVIKPVKERYDPRLNGRTVLKYISVDYHDRRNDNLTEDH